MTKQTSGAVAEQNGPGGHRRERVSEAELLLVPAEDLLFALFVLYLFRQSVCHWGGWWGWGGVIAVKLLS